MEIHHSAAVVVLQDVEKIPDLSPVSAAAAAAATSKPPDI